MTYMLLACGVYAVCSTFVCVRVCVWCVSVAAADLVVGGCCDIYAACVWCVCSVFYVCVCACVCVVCVSVAAANLVVGGCCDTCCLHVVCVACGCV